MPAPNLVPSCAEEATAGHGERSQRPVETRLVPLERDEEVFPVAQFGPTNNKITFLGPPHLRG